MEVAGEVEVEVVVTIGINGRGKCADALKATIDKMISEKPEGNIGLKCLTWYPGGLAYSLPASKKDLKRGSSLGELLLKIESDGLMSREDTASIIPPLFLDVKTEHDVRKKKTSFLFFFFLVKFSCELKEFQFLYI
ncbi:hypothetical protein BSKO_05910 [Bryopsis sp. KO-2023]|nr:hypothetical protein BSKO_05910 [Bryopsis sp. KO-2023]